MADLQKVPYAALPTVPPLHMTVLVWLVLREIRLTGPWVGVVWTLVVIVWILQLVAIVKQREINADDWRRRFNG